MQKRPHLARPRPSTDKTRQPDISKGSSLSLSRGHKLSRGDRNGKMKREREREESEGGGTAQNIPKTTATSALRMRQIPGQRTTNHIYPHLHISLLEIKMSSNLNSETKSSDTAKVASHALLGHVQQCMQPCICFVEFIEPLLRRPGSRRRKRARQK